MSTVQIPPTLRPATGGEKLVEASGETVGDLLDDLMSRFPELRSQLPYANVYVDGEDIRTLDEFETPVHSESRVILLPAMAGGVSSAPSDGTRRHFRRLQRLRAAASSVAPISADIDAPCVLASLAFRSPKAGVRRPSGH